MSIALRIIKGIFSLLFALLVLFILGFFLWRIIASGTPKSMKPIVPTEQVRAVYAEDGEEMSMFRQDQRNITSSEGNYGYFSVTDYVIIPDADQVQMAFRYNNSTLRSTQEDFGLESAPSRDENTYDVTLVVAIDLTPEDDSDNFGNDEGSVRFVRCHGDLVASEQKNLYNFRRFVFDLSEEELDISQLMADKLLLAIYADVYYVGSIDYEQSAYGTLCLYDYKTPNIAVELDKKDIEALENR